MYEILPRIHRPEDVKALTAEECTFLCQEIRSYLVESVSENGGHLSSNLGVVELTVALHRVFDAPKDKFIFDVGHQAYVHKILTGRAEGFMNLRRQGGLSGFPRTEESEYDLFNSGHASSAISLGYGMAAGRDALGEDYHVVCVVGDGALTGGMAYEALNNAGKGRHKMIIILNDNGMAIAHSVGSISHHLNRLRAGEGYLKSKRDVKNFLNSQKMLQPVYRFVNNAKDRLKYAAIRGGIIFEEMGLTYLGPVDGHNIQEMEEVFTNACAIDKPVIIHVKTCKGKGYAPAENNPELYHGVGPFNQEKGAEESQAESYSSLLGQKLSELTEKDSRVHCITAAMAYGCGLSEFADKYPKRFHDVGIAEGHGAAFAAGLAKAGIKPFYAVYSTFMQRAYDQVLEDIALNRLPVTLLLDRSGISGNDGETHQGIFDLSYLCHIPGLTVMAPASAEDFDRMMDFAYLIGAPSAIRYPKGKPWHEQGLFPETPLEMGKGRVLKKGNDVCIMALGACVPLAMQAAEQIENEGGSASVFDLRFASPLDEKEITELASTHRMVITMEDHIKTGGVGERIGAILAEKGIKTDFHILAYPDAFIPHGDRNDLMKQNGVSVQEAVKIWKAAQ